MSNSSTSSDGQNDIWSTIKQRVEIFYLRLNSLTVVGLRKTRVGRLVLAGATSEEEKQFGDSVLRSALSAVLMVTAPYALGVAYLGSIGTSASYLLGFVAYASSSIGNAALGAYGYAYWRDLAAKRFVRQSKEVIDHVDGVSMETYDGLGRSFEQNTIMQLSTIEEAVGNHVPAVVGSWCVTGAALLTTAITAPVLLPVLGAVMFGLHKYNRHLHKENLPKSQELNAAQARTTYLLSEALGRRSIEQERLFGNDGGVRTKWSTESKKYVQFNLRTQKFRARSTVLAGAAVIGLVGLVLLPTGLLSPIELIGMIFVAGRLSDAAASRPEAEMRLGQGLDVEQKRQEILRLPQEKQGTVRQTIRDPRGVVFDDVTFGYGSNAPILHGISLDISPGERVFLVGGTGWGKSTFVKLLSGLYKPHEGKGSVKIGGIDTRDASREFLNRHVAVVPQDPSFGPGQTLKDILAPRPGDFDRAMRLCKQLELMDLVHRCEGFNTPIADPNLFSGGEKKRIAVARALLREPSILVFDEATGGLDTLILRKEMDVIDAAIAAQSPPPTAVFIEHRLAATIGPDDFVVVMAGGRVVQMGTGAELREAPGLFASMQTAEQAKLNERSTSDSTCAKDAGL